MTRTVIIVDDNEMDRKLLREQLQNEYDIIEATNGLEFLQLLEKEGQKVSAVVLDILMPVMNGFEALKEMRSHKRFTNIPVVIITVSNDIESKRSAIEYGANGFLTKPYDPYLIRKCVENVIAFRENAALLSTLSTDKLTGLINHELFFDECDKLIQSHEPGYYMLSCVDIDQFKVINDQYGMEIGDQVLKHIAECIRTCNEDLGGLACRYSADRFAVLYPASLANTSVILNNHKVASNPPCIKHSIRLRIGRYSVNDLSLNARMIYERATVAEESMKGRYDVYIAEYNDSMRARILHEQQIVVEMGNALSSRQFVPFLQPQYNHATGALIGAEVLVRWKKDDGFVSPGEFIPIFERNGFVYEVDKYIWEQACILLRKWLDEKRNVLPISVNVSRVDLYRDGFFETVCGLIEKYRLPVDLLCLEVTESAFTGSSEQIVKVVNQLIRYGFTVEIDDFGSGYSSLNTLKDVPASILKLDMMFFAGTENAVRSGNIIESVVRMAKWLDMAVIAEGVERPEQADYLKSIGCYYIQGYLYAKPMPVEDYEKVLENETHEKRLTRLKTVATLDNTQFWNPESMETLIFNSYVGGACIIEQYKGQLEVLRINSQYLVELGNILLDESNLTVMNPANYLDKDNLFLLNQTISKAITSKNETFCELKITNLMHETEYIRYSVRLIATTQERNMIYCVVLNMTEQRMTERKLMEVERKEIESAQRLKVIMDSVQNGITATIIHGDKAEFVLANDKFYELHGLTKDAEQEILSNVLSFVHPKDRDIVHNAINSMMDSDTSVEVEYRIIRPDGMVVWLRSVITKSDITGIEEPVQVAVYSDITEEKNANNQLKFLNESAHDILAQNDTELAINETLKKLLDYFHSDRSYVIELNYTQMISVNTYEVCAQNVSKEIDNLQAVPFSEQDYWYESLSKNNSYIIDDVNTLSASDQKLYKLLKSQNIQSLIFVSLMRDGKLIGFLGLDNPRRDRNQTERLKAISDYIAILLTRRDLNRSIEKSELERKEMEEEYRLAALHSGRTIGRYDVEKEVLTIMAEDAKRLELPEQIEDVPNGRIKLGKVSPDTAESYKKFYEDIKKGKPEGTVMFQKVLPSGWRWVSAHSTTIFSEEGKPVTAVISYLDITDSYEKDAIYTKWQQSLENRPDRSYSLFRCDLSQSASYDVSEGRLIRFKYKDGKEMSFDECTETYANEHVYQEDREQYLATLSLEKLIKDYHSGKRRAIFEYREIVNQKKEKWIRRSIDLVGRPDSDGVIAYLMYEDIDKSKREELDIKTLAETDSLTGLLNRKAFQDRMANAIQTLEEGTLLAFFILDLDIFKQINDTLGHAEGDRVLIEIGKIIHSALWDCDLIGRLGGDEFVFCMLNVPNKDIIRKKARRIWKLTHRIIDDSLTLSSSIGIAVCPEDGNTFEELYAMADKALYMVKENGKDNYGFYSNYKELKKKVDI